MNKYLLLYLLSILSVLPTSAEPDMNFVIEGSSYCDSGRQVGPKTYRLSNDTDKKLTVAVINITKAGEASCSMPIMGGPATSLKDLTLEKALQKWGTAKSDRKTKTFVLWTIAGDRNPYSVDTRFNTEGTLEEYCVRGKEIKNSRWIKV
jgi:hypothetical protein